MVFQQNETIYENAKSEYVSECKQTDWMNKKTNNLTVLENRKHLNLNWIGNNLRKNFVLFSAVENSL